MNEDAKGERAMVTYTVTTIGSGGARYVGLIDGYTPREAAIAADERFGRSCPGGLVLVSACDICGTELRWAADAGRNVCADKGACARRLELAPPATIFFAVGDVGAHDGYVTARVGPAWPVPGGWTYQDITGAHGTVLYEGTTREEAQRELDAWLVCDDEHCYTHGARA